MDFPAWRRVLLLLGAATTLARAAAPLLSPAEIDRELRSLATTGTVLHLAAHPDDENTELITYLSLGRGYRTAYLSLTRGDGGQNELGSDFGEKLGVLRTQELLAARRLDHGRQFFTRAIDFGFSKSPEETLHFWNRDAVLGDVVRLIRQFRPDVIVTRFPIPPGSGGHGHHTASAILAVEAFKLAADPAAYPEQLQQGLTPWQPRRVLWNSFRIGSAGPGTLNNPVFKQDIGGTDPVSGEEFGTIAARSRAMHKTQGLAGAINRARLGPNEQSFMLLAGEPASSDLMDGIDTTWARYPGGTEIDTALRTILAAFQPGQPSASIPALLSLRAQFAALPADPLVADKRAQLDRILQACLGLTVSTTADRGEIVPGEPIRLTVTHATTTETPGLRYLETRSPALPLTTAKPGELTGVLPTGTPLTQPYWLRADGADGISQVDDPALIGRPENPPVIPLEHIFALGDQTLVVPDEPLHQGRRLAVIPPVALTLGSDIYLVAPGTAKQVTVELTAARPNTRGQLHLTAPAGWTITPGTQSFHLAATGDKAALTFTVTAPPSGGSGRLNATADIDGRHYSTQRIELNYSHLPPQLLQPPARARLASFPLATQGLTVGYLPGAGDSVAECIAQMGYVVRALTGADLTPEKLAGLDAVVLGVRAFNDRDDLAAAFPGLLAWVEQGGTVIAQYNRTDRPLRTKQLGPYPLSLEGQAATLRVTDETAPVTFLLPDHAAVNQPNRITPADFDGWVQERGTYFPSKWDEEHYASLFAMSDPGEAPLRSGLLIARHGRGHYVYAGLTFFRQLPAGVPGAYRLFANLLALGR
jgi:LmbE family N-acetylglucosaminyl deacetylase